MSINNFTNKPTRYCTMTTQLPSCQSRYLGFLKHTIPKNHSKRRELNRNENKSSVEGKNNKI